MSTDVARYTAAALTDVGSKRPSNEDAFGYSAEQGAYIVCDGMGGAAAGEIASSMAVEVVLHGLSRRADSQAPLEHQVAEAIRAANEAIFTRARENQQLNGMGTTLVGIVVEGSRVLVFNVGDSRCYIMRFLRPGPSAAEPNSSVQENQGEACAENCRLHQISLDHSLVEEQVRMGRMTHEEALHANYRNVITRALGTQPTVEPDIFELQALPGDIFLLCTDGLTGEISDEVIETILAQELPLDELCVNLIEAAKRAGGHDNITCTLVRAEG
ncbi:MAG: PP2C family serine/threonine-protein phosphatase [Terracidiphilus sp.]